MFFLHQFTSFFEDVLECIGPGWKCEANLFFFLFLMIVALYPFGLWSLYGYGSIPIDTFLVGWTSIYQLFWGSLGTRVLTHPHMMIYFCCSSFSFPHLHLPAPMLTPPAPRPAPEVGRPLSQSQSRSVSAFWRKIEAFRKWGYLGYPKIISQNHVFQYWFHHRIWIPISWSNDLDDLRETTNIS
jgi:hypothetical protein